MLSMSSARSGRPSLSLTENEIRGRSRNEVFRDCRVQLVPPRARTSRTRQQRSDLPLLLAVGERCGREGRGKSKRLSSTGARATVSHRLTRRTCRNCVTTRTNQSTHERMSAKRWRAWRPRRRHKADHGAEPWARSGKPSRASLLSAFPRRKLLAALGGFLPKKSGCCFDGHAKRHSLRTGPSQ